MHDAHELRERRSALLGIALFALAKLALHTWINRQYGFHRDELATLDDARHLAWGFVAYPPLTPFFGRIALTLFGTSLAGFRFFAAAAQAVAIVLTGDIARRLGGARAAQWLAAIAVAVAPISLGASSLFQYVAFDYLWWVVIAWGMTALVASEDPRWWLVIGAGIGLGVLTKYAIAFCVAGVVLGVLLTPRRRDLRSKYLWLGVAVAVVIAAPNLLWEVRHDFITLDFLKSIHQRDIEIGRTSDFLVNQLYVPANPLTIPLWAAGLAALFFVRSFARFRILAWVALVPFVLFIVAKGRDYYAGPLYPPLLAAGSVLLLSLMSARAVRWTLAIAIPILLAAGGAIAALILPVAPPGSAWFRRALEENGDLREELGWPELAGEVARIWQTIPASERAHAAIYCANYGEAGAIGLYGPAHGLPPAISGVNSFWARGYGDPPPDIVIVVGARRERLEQRFGVVELAGHVPNPWHVANEEAGHPEIYVCRGPRVPWAQLWPQIRSFG
ncbi:MAG: glycosyltransferase family 39 protein [Acidobacteria bacterium]|nr:glycosyltransferase family 39 protein [Acidobacteriota bacterium]MBV9477564.1 glycosyltransferase family 39 protein [Acidobacteriota bacterium]